MRNEALGADLFAQLTDDRANKFAPEWSPIVKAFIVALTLSLALPASAQTVSTETPEPEVAASVSPRYLLMAPGGRAMTQEDFRGKFQLVAFGFVSCPDVCPTTMLEYQHVLQALGPDAARLQPIFITVDPERDTPEILKAYTAAFDARILGLTGSPELVKRAADNFRIQYEKVREPGAPADVYTMNHSAGMILLDERGVLLTRFPYGKPTAEIVERLRGYMASGSH